MSKRKPHNLRARLERSCRALLATNHVAVVNFEPSGQQVLVNWKSCKQIRSRQIVDAVCDIAHRWTIYIAGLCVSQGGEAYIKSLEVSPDGIHLAEKLTDLIQHFYKQVSDKCNPNHRVAMAWLAIPDIVSVDEAQAAAVFKAVGVWSQESGVRSQESGVRSQESGVRRRSQHEEHQQTHAVPPTAVACTHPAQRIEGGAAWR